MKRLFTFGCSFTGYVYPTWVDFLALDRSSFDMVFNYGREGGGNKYILATLLRVIQEFDLGPEDTIAVMFTSAVRYDYLDLRGNLTTSGNIFNSDLYRKYPETLSKVWNINTGIFDTWVSIDSFLNIAKNLPCKVLTPMFAFGREKLLHEDLVDSFCSNELYSIKWIKQLDTENNLSTFSDRTYSRGGYVYKNDEDGGPFIDRHPTIKDHCAWVQHMFPEHFQKSFWDVAEEWEKNIIGETYRQTYLNYHNYLFTGNIVRNKEVHRI